MSNIKQTHFVWNYHKSRVWRFSFQAMTNQKEPVTMVAPPTCECQCVVASTSCSNDHLISQGLDQLGSLQTLGVSVTQLTFLITTCKYRHQELWWRTSANLHTHWEINLYTYLHSYRQPCLPGIMSYSLWLTPVIFQPLLPWETSLYRSKNII